MIENKLKIKTCKYLVVDETYPGIEFDDDGISNIYHDYINNVQPIINLNDDKTLWKNIEKIKSDGIKKEYDCILGLSGGLDSSFMLHKAIVDYKLRPLVFHVDAGWNSNTAVHNINSMVRKLGIDLYTEVIDWEEITKFQKALFKSGVPHLDIPQDMAFVSVLYKYAKKNKIKWILNGGNISSEGVPRPYKLFYWGTDMRNIRDILRKYSDNKFETYPFSSAIYHKFILKYMYGLKVFKPLNFKKYVKNEAISILEKEYNWKPYSQKHFESRFTKFYEGYWLIERFNFDIRKVDLSSLILSDQISRNEALKILENRPLSTEDEIKDFKFIADKLNMTTDELNSYQTMEKKYYYDYKNSSKLFNIGEKVMYKLAKTRRGGAF